MKKSLKIIFVLFIFTMLVGNFAYAGNMVDYSADPDICRFSDHVDETNTLPFVRISAGKTDIDSEVNKSGICISAADLNVLSDMSKVQLLISGSEIKLNGAVEHSVLFSPKTVINGNVNGTVLMFSTVTNISKDASINGDLIILGAQVTFDGKCEGNVIIVADNVVIGENANVSGSLRITGANIEAKDQAVVTGKLYTRYSENLSLPNALKEVALIVKSEFTGSERNISIPIFEIVITSLILGAIYILFKTKSKIIDNSVEKLKGATSKVIISGIVGLFGTPLVVIAALIISILGLYAVGVPVLVIVIGMIIIAAILKGFFVSLIITELMLKTEYAKYFDANLNKFILFTVVLIITSLLGYIPVVGGYIDYLLIILSFGTLITLTLLRKSLNKQSK